MKSGTVDKSKRYQYENFFEISMKYLRNKKMLHRRDFCKLSALGLSSAILPTLDCSRTMKRPNIIIILTDDQGYGDYGVMGNPVLKTPHIDRLCREGAQMSNFYVSPVCAPTRACLLTGRYNYRTRVVDTWVGRAMMEPAEITIAELLRRHGYATGLFGKWHLGDCYPMRPQDKGFEEVLVHRGGGIGQPSDPPGGEGKYTDPVLFHNGQRVVKKGYCTDIYFNDAMAWMEKMAHAQRPFFLYLPTNAPHTPLQDVPQDLYRHYKQIDLSNNRFPQDKGHKLDETGDPDKLARIYAMIANIDLNLGRLSAKLDELAVADQTIILYMNDNGPQGRRYLAGMRGEKTSVYEGGIRSPLFLRWPSHLQPGTVNDRVVAHIDILPTLLDACSVSIPGNLDGKSFWPLLTGQITTWPDRAVFIQSHRGDCPVLYHNIAVRTQDWKLVHASGFARETFSGSPKFELFDMKNDPLEMHDVAARFPGKVAELKNRYEQWFAEVSRTRIDNYSPPRIHIGTDLENPVTLTRQDWRHEQGQTWAEASNGFWPIRITASGVYMFTVRFHSERQPGQAILCVGSKTWDATFSREQTELHFGPILLEESAADVRITLRTAGAVKGPWQVDVLKKMD
jgi:arylsulfatase/arylsulfatase A